MSYFFLEYLLIFCALLWFVSFFTYLTYSLYEEHTWQNIVILDVKTKERMNVFLTELQCFHKFLTALRHNNDHGLFSLFYLPSLNDVNQ